MRTPAAALLATLVTGNSLLWLSYAFFKPSSSEFGNIPRQFHTYFLTCAAAAYAAQNAGLALLTAGSGALSDAELLLTTFSLALHLAAQIAFTPLTRNAVSGKLSKNWVRLLMAVSFATSLIFFVLASTVSAAAAILTALSMCHIFINDLVWFAFAF